MTTKMVFHGSDIEKICDYYHLNKEDIVKFGANVNRLKFLLLTSPHENCRKYGQEYISIRSPKC